MDLCVYLSKDSSESIASEARDRPTKGADGLGMLLRAPMSRLDGDDDAGLILATANDLGREASAKGNRAGERDARQALQDAGLSSRLLSSNDDLEYEKYCVTHAPRYLQSSNQRVRFLTCGSGTAAGTPSSRSLSILSRRTRSPRPTPFWVAAREGAMLAD
jgi:hypothetical protein